jgi:hypothetical protein
MKKPKQKSRLGQAPTVGTVGFPEWRKRFDSMLRVGTAAWKAFRTLLEQEQQSRVKWQLQLEDLRGQVLDSIYKETSPLPAFDENALKDLAHTQKALKDLVTQLNSVIGKIRTTGVVVVSYGGVRLDFSADLEIYQRAANSARYSLQMLEARGPESLRRDAVDQGLSFLLSLEGLVPESEANALAKLALKAHGHHESDLTDLDDVRSGKVRKRKDALRERYAKALIEMKSYTLRL